MVQGGVWALQDSTSLLVLYQNVELYCLMKSPKMRTFGVDKYEMDITVKWQHCYVEYYDVQFCMVYNTEHHRVSRGVGQGCKKGKGVTYL